MRSDQEDPSQAERDQALIRACARGSLAELNEALAAGADPGAVGRFELDRGEMEVAVSPLIATLVGSTSEKRMGEKIEALLAAGADVNQKIDWKKAGCEHGWSSAMSAMMMGPGTGMSEAKRRLGLKKLLAAGAEAQPWLRRALNSGDIWLVRELVSAGADPWQPQESKRSELAMIAVEKGLTQLARELLEVGAERLGEAEKLSRVARMEAAASMMADLSQSQDLADLFEELKARRIALEERWELSGAQSAKPAGAGKRKSIRA